MAEITRRRTGEYLRILFDVFAKNPDGLRAGDAIAQVRGRLTLTEYEKGTYETGGTRFEKVLRFATVDCVKAGWMLKNKGIWIPTDIGREAFKKFPDPEDFHREAVRLYNQWRKAQPSAEDGAIEAESGGSLAKEASVTYEEADEQAREEIRQFVSAMNPYDVQALLAALLRAMGYHVAWVSPKGKDGGLDVLAWSDPLGTRPPRIKAQVKRLQASANVSDLRAFMALLGEGDVGIFFCVGGFTKDAEDEARTQEKRQIALLDLARFLDLWIQYYGKLEDSARQLLPLKPIYFLAPEA